MSRAGGGARRGGSGRGRVSTGPDDRRSDAPSAAGEDQRAVVQRREDEPGPLLGLEVEDVLVAARPGLGEGEVVGERDAPARRVTDRQLGARSQVLVGTLGVLE